MQEYKPFKSGKVREMYDNGDSLIMVATDRISAFDHILKNMIEKHVAHTGSEKGKEILTHFDEYLPKFKKIIPNDYKRMMMLSAQMEDKGLSSEQAQIEAFYESMRK